MRFLILLSILQVVEQGGTDNFASTSVTVVTIQRLRVIQLRASVNVPWDGLESDARRIVRRAGLGQTALTNAIAQLDLYVILHPGIVTVRLDCTARSVISVSVKLIEFCDANTKGTGFVFKLRSRELNHHSLDVEHIGPNCKFQEGNLFVHFN
jgi:hypothetical protein